MKAILKTAALTTVAVLLAASAEAAPGLQTAAKAPISSSPAAAKSGAESNQAAAYYDFTMGHLHELEYETNGNDSLATQALQFYKKALGLEPGSSVIMERIAEVYAESNRIHDAEMEARQALKADPNNKDAHQLLARIYIRALGSVGPGEGQADNIAKAIAQFQAVLKLDPDDAYSALWLARLYGFQNQPDQAEEVLRNFLQREPGNEGALEELSQLLIDEGHPEQAISLLTQATADSNSSDLYDLLGSAYAHAQDFGKAEAAYRQAIQQDPDDPGHRHGLAQALMAQGKYAAALEQYKKLSALEPASAQNYVRMAQLDRRLKKFDDANSNLMRAEQLAPGNLEVLYNEALLREDEGRYGDAEKVLSDAIAGLKSQKGGRNATALAILYEQLGHAYREQNNYSAAIETFKDMAKLGPDAQSRARLLLIDTYRASGDYIHAIAEAKVALQDSPKDRDLTVTLALLYGEQAETARATHLLKGLLRGNLSDQEVYLDLAQVQERGRKYAQAEKSASKAAQLARNSSEKQNVWFMLGSIYERQRKYGQAEKEFRKVLAVNPNNAPVLNYYGYMLANRGVRVREATSLIQRALKQQPNNGAYLDSLGWAYYKQGKLVEAEEYLQKAVDREGNDPTILSHLGYVYLKLGDNEHAEQLFERSLARWQKALPADYQADKVSQVEAQLKNLKKRLAQKSAPEIGKPQ